VLRTKEIADENTNVSSGRPMINTKNTEKPQKQTRPLNEEKDPKQNNEMGISRRIPTLYNGE
jgi:hypothetical protein